MIKHDVSLAFGKQQCTDRGMCPTPFVSLVMLSYFSYFFHSRMYRKAWQLSAKQKSNDFPKILAATAVLIAFHQVVCICAGCVFILLGAYICVVTLRVVRL